jgi:hypothetical protein
MLNTLSLLWEINSENRHLAVSYYLYTTRSRKGLGQLGGGRESCGSGYFLVPDAFLTGSDLILIWSQ